MIQHFHGYLNGSSLPNLNSHESDTSNDNQNADDGNKENIANLPEKKKQEYIASLVYVKKWMRTKHAILFRLSNKIVQVCFQDKSEIILASDSRMVTYQNRQGIRKTYTLQEALESTDQEMTKRLKYTKDVVATMV